MTAQRRAVRATTAVVSRSEPLPIVICGALGLTDPLWAGLHALSASGAVRVQTWVRPTDASPTETPSTFPELRISSTLERSAAPSGSLLVLGASRNLVSQISAGLKRGWHVLVVSPLSQTTRDAEALFMQARHAGRILTYDHHWRFHPAAEYIRDLCRNEVLGPMFTFAVQEGSLVGDEVTDVWPAVGALAASGAGPLDLLGWWFGPPTLLDYQDDAMGGSEANARLEMSFGQRARGTLHLSHDWEEARAYKLLFERGIVRWDPGQPARLTVQLANTSAALNASLGEPLPPDTGCSLPPPGHVEDSATRMLRNLRGAIEGTRTLRFTDADALRLCSLFDDCHARRRWLALPWFTSNETARAKTLAAPPQAKRT